MSLNAFFEGCKRLFWHPAEVPDDILLTVRQAQLDRALTHVPMIYAVAIFNLAMVMILCAHEGVPLANYWWMGPVGLFAALRMVLWIRRSRSPKIHADPERILKGLTIVSIGLISFLSGWSIYAIWTGLLGNITFIPISLVFGSTCIAHCLTPLKRAAVGVLIVGVVPSALGMISLGRMEEAILGFSMLTIAFLMVRFIVASYREIIKGILLEEQIRRQANSDPLTGLANRRAMMAHIEAAEVEYQKNSESYGVALLDLDRFKQVNDELGHHIGDALLKEVAVRLTTIAQDGETVGRLGGDEFVVLMRGPKKRDEAAARVDAFLMSFAQPAEIEGHHASLAGSMGFAVRAIEGTSASDLLKRADMAQYAMKSVNRENPSALTAAA